MKITTFFLLLLISISCCAQENSATKKVDELFKQIDSKTPGYMVGVIKENDFVFKKGYGSANLEHEIPINSKSAFNVASLSKQFTAACIALLIIEKKISLEDKVEKYFSDFPFSKSGMQIKHLIYMTSGINDYYYNPRTNDIDWSSLNFFNIDTAIQASFNSGELMYQPGTKWSYSNINYMLLTKIVEKVSGQHFSEFINDKIFIPLQMTNSFVNDDIFQVIPNRVNGYNFRDKENTDWLIESGYLKSEKEGFLQINRNSPHYGGSGVFTTMEDLKKWIVNFQTKDFGGEEFYSLMHKTMKFEHNKSDDAFGLAFGDFNGDEIVWYEGGDWGFSAYMMRFPKNNTTVICLSNLGTGNARNFANQITDILIEEKIINLD